MLSHFWLDIMPSYRRWNLCRICAKIFNLFSAARQLTLVRNSGSSVWNNCWKYLFVLRWCFGGPELLLQRRISSPRNTFKSKEHLAAQRDEEPAYLFGRADWSKRPTRVLFICSRRSRRQPFRRECVWATIASWIVGKKTILVLWTHKLNSNEGTYILLSVTGNLMSSLFLIFEFSYIPVGSWTTASYYADGNLI